MPLCGWRVHEQDKVLEVKLECLDNLTDLLKRFGR